MRSMTGDFAVTWVLSIDDAYQVAIAKTLEMGVDNSLAR